jgi:hypothetical protein
MNPFHRTCAIGRDRDGDVLWVRITLEDKADGQELSFHGVVGPRRNGDASGSSGQIVRSRPTCTTWINGWDDAKLSFLYDLWERWHLNLMNAGTPTQMAHLRALPGGVPVYRTALAVLTDAGLQPDPATGYSYGSQWLHETVNHPDVLEWLAALEHNEGCAWADWADGR